MVPMALPFLPFAAISLPMVPLVIELVPTVQILPTNGIIGKPRTQAMTDDRANYYIFRVLGPVYYQHFCDLYLFAT